MTNLSAGAGAVLSSPVVTEQAERKTKEIHTLQTNNKKLFAVLVGWALVALGVVGVVLPILPGIPLLLVGLFVLSSEYVWAHQLLGRIRERFPAASRKVQEWSECLPDATEHRLPDASCMKNTSS